MTKQNKYTVMADNTIEALAQVLDRSGSGLSSEATVEMSKVYAMLAQAEALEGIAAALWSLGSGVDGVAAAVGNIND